MNGRELAVGLELVTSEAFLGAAALALLGVWVALARGWGGRRQPGIVPVVVTLAVAAQWRWPDAGRWLVFVIVAAVAVPVAARSSRAVDPRWWITAAAVTAVGLVGVLPDVDRALALLGALTVLAAAAWLPDRWLRLGVTPAGARVVGLVLGYAIALDGTARTSALAGGIGCLGVLVAAAVAGDRVALHGRVAGALALGVHLAVVLTASRAAGVLRDGWRASWLVAGLLAVVTTAAVVVTTARRTAWRRGP